MRKIFFALLMVFAVLAGGVSYADSTFGDANDVSIDRVKVNGKSVSESRTNFIEKADDFDVNVDLTATEDISNMHVEAILTDLQAGNTVSDSTGTFDLKTNQSTLVALNLELIDLMKKQADFRLVVRVVDVEGSAEEKSFGLKLSGAGGGTRSGAGNQLDVSIDSVEIEGNAIAESENNFIIVDKGEKKLKLRVRLTALGNVEDAHIDAVLAFENGNVVADATSTFDILDGLNSVNELELPLISKFEQNNFRLKVKVVDAEGDAEEKLYGLRISQKKFPFVISSIGLDQNAAEAGKSIVAKLSFKNSGVVPLEGVYIKASIPELGISSSKFADRISYNADSDFNEEFILKIPENAQTGTYTLKAELVSQFAGESEAREIPLFVAGKNDQKLQVVNEKLIINVPVSIQEIKNDGSEVVYPFILTNQGPDSNTYTLMLDGAGWARLRLSESNTFVINPKESKTISIFASTKTKAEGEQIFLANVKSNRKVLKQIPLKGDVVAVKGLLAARLKSLLEIMLIAAVVALAVFGLLLGAKKYLQGNNDAEDIPDETAGEAYY